MGNSKGYRITFPDEGYEALSELAREQKRPIANVIRDAIEEYLRAHGKDISLAVNRGGYRERKDKEGLVEKE